MMDTRTVPIAEYRALLTQVAGLERALADEIRGAEFLAGQVARAFDDGKAVGRAEAEREPAA